MPEHNPERVSREALQQRLAELRAQQEEMLRSGNEHPTREEQAAIIAEIQQLERELAEL